ncbi:myristoylated alanine-rich C-kinase substrate-like [Kogia breviceps]|uniref:myristoylated alanine-rich C-kinase substrate-like n=1 Tax=Kogia breviceps TaxID=27615 RepID=UPI0034D1C380
MAGAPAPARPRVSSGGGGAASPWAAWLPSPGPAACPRRRSARARATAAARPGSPRRRHGGRRAAASASRSARLRAGGRKRFRFRGRGRSGCGNAATRGRGAHASGWNAGGGRRERWQRGGAAPGLGVGGRRDSGSGPPGPALCALSRPAPRHRTALCPGSGCATEEGALPRARAARRRRREGSVRGREVARRGVLRGDAGTECFEQEKPGATHFPYEETEHVLESIPCWVKQPEMHTSLCSGGHPGT